MSEAVHRVMDLYFVQDNWLHKEMTYLYCLINLFMAIGLVRQ